MPLRINLIDQVSFEPVGKVTHVFYDDRNHQVFSVRSGGATGMMCRSFEESKCSTFRLEDEGKIITIKLSPDQKILAIQRSRNDVHFVGVESTGQNGVLDGRKYSQSCRVKQGTLLGFSWMSPVDIAFFTNQSIEIYNIIHERKLVKTVRSQNHSIAWYHYCSKTSVLAVSPSSVSSLLTVFSLRGGYIYKLGKIEYDNVEFREKDVVIVTGLYGNQFVAVFVHQPNGQVDQTEIHLHRITDDSTIVKMLYVLKVPVSGNMALSVTDDLLLLHHQFNGKSFVFDIALGGDKLCAASTGMPSYLTPVCSGRIWLSDPQPGLSVDQEPGGSQNMPYSMNWITFQPDVIVDAKSGLMWKLQLSLDAVDDVMAEVPDLVKLISFLQERKSVKSVLLQVLVRACQDDSGTPLRTMGSLFDILSQQYRQFLDLHMQQNLALPALSFPSPTSAFRSTTSSTANDKKASCAKVVVDQADLYTNVFSPLTASGCHPERLTDILMEYFRSLVQLHVPVQHFLNELLINLLVQQGTWFQLHQLLQYHVISSSKPLACLLLSLENVYEPAYQLAMDMLFRLRSSNEEICEILLSKKQVLVALKFAEDKGLDHIPARKFLDLAVDTEDDMLFYNVFTTLRDRGMLASHGLDRYHQHFKAKFPEDSC